MFKLLEISRVTYKDVFKKVSSFISLDISLHGTGWLKYKNGVEESGVFSIKSPEEDDVGRRREFREFIVELFNGETFDYVFIEDTIGSLNYKTAKILYQLNPITDDLMEYGLIPSSPIIREKDSVWKKHLRQCSGYRSKIVAETDEKKMVREALSLIDFGDGTTKNIEQDIYDAYGMSVGVIYRLKVLGERKKKKRLKTNVRSGYKVKQYNDIYDAVSKATELGQEFIEVDLVGTSRDLEYHFKKIVYDNSRDDLIFIISIETSRIGVLAIAKKLDLEIPTSHLILYR